MSMAADGSVEVLETEEERMARFHRETEVKELGMSTEELRSECVRMVQCWLMEVGPTNWSAVTEQVRVLVVAVVYLPRERERERLTDRLAD